VTVTILQAVAIFAGLVGAAAIVAFLFSRDD
jgi:hypothetical protein